jgi:hypothetical protein
MNIDIDNLANEFNMDNTFNQEELERNAIDIGEAIRIDHSSNPDKVISDTIGKANAILDRVILEINNSGMTPRLGEVAGQLIQAINTAAGQVYTKDFNFGSLHIKQKMLELKKREIDIKERLSEKSTGCPSTVNQNLIITDRETVMKMLRESKEQIKMLENNQEENT